MMMTSEDFAEIAAAVAAGSATGNLNTRRVAAADARRAYKLSVDDKYEDLRQRSAQTREASSARRP